MLSFSVLVIKWFTLIFYWLFDFDYRFCWVFLCFYWRNWVL